MTKSISFLIILITLFTSLVVNAAQKTPAEIIQSVTKGAHKGINLPNSNDMVVFSEDGTQAIVLTGNPRWVIKGELYDMFQDKQITSNVELKNAARKIPFKSLKIDTVHVLSFTVNPTKDKSLVVFIDPFINNAADAITTIAHATSSYRVRYILIPSNQDSVEKLMNFACHVTKESSAKLVQRIKTRVFGQTSDVCAQDLVSKSYGLAGFLKLRKSPTLIASNDEVSSGMPISIVSYLLKNME